MRSPSMLLGVIAALAAVSSVTAAPVKPPSNQILNNFKITAYGYDDNDDGNGHFGNDIIAHPVLHKVATEDLGTYANPSTFAGDESAFTPGDIIYVPHLRKYFIYEDGCGACKSDAAQGINHVDLYIGESKLQGAALGNCEDAVTLISGGTVVLNPTSDWLVSSPKVFVNDVCNSQTFPIPNGPPGATPTPTGGSTTPTGGSSAVTFAPYIDATMSDVTPISFNALTGTSRFTLAFVIADGNGNPQWYGHGTDMTYYSSQIAAIRAAGGDITISFGGASGTELALVAKDATSLANAYLSVVNAYNANWIDFDVEGGAAGNTASIDLRNKAIAILQSKIPSLKVSYTVATTVNGLVSSGIYIVDSAVANKARVDVLNIMAMDYFDSSIPYADASGNSLMGAYAIQATKATYAQVGSKVGSIGITPMIGVNDDAKEVFTLADAAQVAAWAKTVSYVSWIGFWSVNADNSNSAGNYAKTFVNALGSKPSVPGATTQTTTTTTTLSKSKTTVVVTTSTTTTTKAAVVASTTTTTTSVPQATSTVAPSGSTDLSSYGWYSGYSTHYGPFPQQWGASEIGYLPNDIGVGCSSGVPGGDPHWNAILAANGVYPSPNGTQTVWPKIATVAVSQKYWASNYSPTFKAPICWQQLWIRNKYDHTKHITAYVVDFCPSAGCTWGEMELGYNVDMYGGASWEALGGNPMDSKIEVEIVWPDYLRPNVTLPAPADAPFTVATVDNPPTVFSPGGPIVQLTPPLPVAASCAPPHDKTEGYVANSLVSLNGVNYQNTWYEAAGYVPGPNQKPTDGGWIAKSSCPKPDAPSSSPVIPSTTTSTTTTSKTTSTTTTTTPSSSSTSTTTTTIAPSTTSTTTTTISPTTSTTTTTTRVVATTAPVIPSSSSTSTTAVSTPPVTTTMTEMVATEDLGTYANPSTFAGDESAFTPGDIIYVPHLRKYFIYEDGCGACKSDAAQGINHVDLYIGESKLQGAALGNCEDAVTLISGGTVVLNPTSDWPVSSQKVFINGVCNSQTFPIPNGPPGATPTPTGGSTTPTGGSSTVTFAPYIDATMSDVTPISFNTLTGTSRFTLAFVTADGNGNPQWYGHGTDMTYYSSQIAAIRAVGGDITISFGGASGTELALVAKDATSLANAYLSVVNAYKANWIDFDVEGGAAGNTASIDLRNKAIAIVQSKIPSLKVSYTVATTVNGLVSSGIYIVDSAVANKARVDVLNIMAMDYFDSSIPYVDASGNSLMGAYAIQATKATYAQVGSKVGSIGITPMIGINDDPKEVFTLADAAQVAAWAKTVSYVSWIGYWSVNADNSNSAGNYAKAFVNALGSKPSVPGATTQTTTTTTTLSKSKTTVVVTTSTTTTTKAAVVASTTTTTTSAPQATSTVAPSGSTDLSSYGWYSGYSTHYGPFPQQWGASEIGYLPNDIGVGCSSGVPGGDPHWNAILAANGVYPSPNGTQTVWPKIATVAVSQKYWASNYSPTFKAPICWQQLWIRNKYDHTKHITAYVVDFCPSAGCTWGEMELGYNVDMYGGASWEALGGNPMDSKIEVEIVWPDYLRPNVTLPAPADAPFTVATVDNPPTVFSPGGPIVQLTPPLPVAASCAPPHDKTQGYVANSLVSLNGVNYQNTWYEAAGYVPGPNQKPTD
ncbi:UNVERIFIED_CONTAM: hypothetical protein HDU68_003411, partial [Siphonaria sp. JEL0065]